MPVTKNRYRHLIRRKQARTHPIDGEVSSGPSPRGQDASLEIVTHEEARLLPQQIGSKPAADHSERRCSLSQPSAASRDPKTRRREREPP